MATAIPRPTGDQMLRARCGRAGPARGLTDAARDHARGTDAARDRAAGGRAGDVALARAAAVDVARARAGTLDVTRGVVPAVDVDRPRRTLDVALGGAARAGVVAVVGSAAHAVIADAGVVTGHAARAEDRCTTQEHQAHEGFHMTVIRRPAAGADITPTSRRSATGFGGAAAPRQLEVGIAGVLAEAAVRRGARAIGRAVEARGDLAAGPAGRGGAAAAVVAADAVRTLIADRTRAGAARARGDAARVVDAVHAALLGLATDHAVAAHGGGGTTAAAAARDAGLGRGTAAIAAAIRVTQKGSVPFVRRTCANDHEQTRDHSQHVRDASTTPRTGTSIGSWSHRVCAAYS